MDFFEVCEVSLRPSEISDGKKEKKNVLVRENGGARMECFSKQISLSEILSVICLKEEERRKCLNFWKEMFTFCFGLYFEHWSSWCKSWRVDYVVWTRCWWNSITVDFHHKGKQKKFSRLNYLLAGYSHVVYPIREVEIKKLILVDWLTTYPDCHIELEKCEDLWF